MRGRSGSRFFAAGAAGTCAVVLTVGLATRSTPPPAETTGQPSPTTTAADWSSEREVRIGPSVIVPLTIEDDGSGHIAFSYEVTPVTPQGGEPALDVIPSTPIAFTLITRDGIEIAATARGPGARTITFDVPDDVTAADAESVRVDSYLVGTPVRFPVDLPTEGAAWHAAGPGVRVRLVRILEQSQNDLVVVELDSPDNAASHLSVDGVGRDWAAASGSMIGSSNWTLDHRGDELPDPMPLVVRGVIFVPIDTELTMSTTGLIR